MTEKAINFVLEQMQSQIKGFTGRRKSLEKQANFLQYSSIICSALSVFSLSLNLKYPESYWAIVALVFSTIALIGHQLLQQFRFQERLRIAIVTRAQLKALQSKLEFQRICGLDNVDAEEFLSQFQSILDDANAAWGAQFVKSISKSEKTSVEVPKI